jgi:hypothetical protein
MTPDTRPVASPMFAVGHLDHQRLMTVGSFDASLNPVLRSGMLARGFAIEVAARTLPAFYMVQRQDGPAETGIRERYFEKVRRSIIHGALPTSVVDHRTRLVR